MSDVRSALVEAANDAFYRAMRTGDLPAMRKLWSRRRRVACAHPNRPMLVGFENVMESWQVILGTYQPPDIVARDVEIVVTGKTAMVLCREDLGNVELIATNSFALEDGTWRILSHQAAHVPGSERP